MTADPKSTASEFLKGGISLEAEIESAGMIIREKSKAAYEQQWLDARLILLSVLRRVQEFRSGVPGQTDQSRSDRLALITVFAQGTSAVERLISEGQYIKATAALKQDYEILARIGEIKAGAAKAGRTPNVKHAPEGTRHFYGELNEVAHPSNEGLLTRLLGRLHSGEVRGLSSVPAFDADTARSLYELHVWLILEIAREAMRLAFEMYPSDQAELAEAARWFATAFGALEEAGFRVEGRDPKSPTA